MPLSISQIKGLLNPVFLERLEKQFGLNMVDKILKGFLEDKSPVIRINTLKTNVREIMAYLKELNVRFERVPSLENALIISNKKEKFFEELDIYKNGKIYFQGISSQLPVIFLDPKPGEKILDMAAAPGSKTAQMAMMMQNKGEILANELNQIRAERLKYNLDKQGITIAKIRLGDGCELGNLYPAYFDKVLLDAPCSAEGRINMKDPRSYKFWSEKNVRNHAKIQKRLLGSAVRALKKGGILVYSTCTLAPEENEMIVDFALNEFKNILKIEKINKAMPSNTYEGFFIAKFKKI